MGFELWWMWTKKVDMLRLIIRKLVNMNWKVNSVVVMYPNGLNKIFSNL